MRQVILNKLAAIKNDQHGFTTSKWSTFKVGHFFIKDFNPNGLPDEMLADYYAEVVKWNVSKNTCEICKYWNKQKDSDFSKDMGVCSKLSGNHRISNEGPDEWPDTKITGIESDPICAHDGPGFVYFTKSWFDCIHHTTK